MVKIYPKQENAMETIHTDILIVGAGLAGFTAAVRASEQGAKVLLVDKSRGELGDGNVLMASGSLRAGGKSPKTGAKELYDFVMAEGVGYPDLVNSWSQTCGRAIDWLADGRCRDRRNRAGKNLAQPEKRNLLWTGLQKRCRPARHRESQAAFSKSRRQLSQRHRRRQPDR